MKRSKPIWLFAGPHAAHCGQPTETRTRRSRPCEQSSRPYLEADVGHTAESVFQIAFEEIYSSDVVHVASPVPRELHLRGGRVLEQRRRRRTGHACMRSQRTSRRPRRPRRLAGPFSPPTSSTRRATAPLAGRTTCNCGSPRACRTRASARAAMSRLDLRGSFTWSSAATRGVLRPTLRPRRGGTAPWWWRGSWPRFPEDRAGRSSATLQVCRDHGPAEAGHYVRYA